ncbi:MAG: hypothetical protein N2445_00985 [Acidobacteria bacterium]|nr:hypothetical protein [Acidobacteriota bacterium]
MPKEIVNLLAERKQFIVKTGTILFCDVAGFTPLTENLSKIGKEGSERLTLLLNRYFTQMIEIVEKYGGDVLRFGGDAMTLFFKEGNEQKSLCCAKEMMKKMEDFFNLSVGEEKFSLSMKIGISKGEALFGLLGKDKGGYDYFVAGTPLDESAEAEHNAEKGEIIIHPRLIKKFRNFLDIKENKFGRLNNLDIDIDVSDINLKPQIESRSDINGMLKELLPDYLLDRAGEGTLGEHRNASVVFLAFKGLEKYIFEKEYFQFYEKIQKVYDFLALTSKNYGGVLNKIDMGDKGMKGIILFGSPYAIEKKEEMAVRCALEILQNNPFKTELSFKIGITTSYLFTGAVGSISRREFTVMGDGINTAARLMQKAEWNHIICDKNSWEKSSSEVVFKELPPVFLKGKEKAVNIYEPLHLGRQSQTFESEDLIEREEAIGKIKRMLLHSGKPLLILGGTGLGKTALLEFAKSESKKINIPVTRVFLAPYHQTRAYSLWKGALRSILGLRKEDSYETVKKTAENYFSEGEKEYSILLNSALGLEQEETDAIKNLSPKDRKELTFALMYKIIINCGERAILADNLENCDPMSLEFLNFFLQGGKGENVKFIFTSRDENANLTRIMNSFEVIELKPFSETAEKKYLENNLNLQNLSQAALNFFHSKSQGNPKYINAIFEMLRNAEVVVKEEEKFYLDEDRLFKTQIPSSLEEIYLKKVDSLTREDREIVQSASVLGYSVSLFLLSYVKGIDIKYLADKFNLLAEKEIFVYDTWGEKKYFKFKDGFLRDAVYESAPFSLKKEIHLKCAQFLEKECEGDNKIWQIIAAHYKGAQEKEKAYYFSKKCAMDAISRYDNVTAMKYLEEICDKGINKENIDCAFNLIKVYSNLGKRDDEQKLVEKIEEQNIPLSIQETLQFLLFKIKWSVIKGDFQKAEELFEEAEIFAKKNNQLRYLAEIYVNKAGGFYGPQGNLEKAKETLEKCLKLPESREIAILKTTALFNFGIILRQEGKNKISFDFFKKAYLKAVRFKLLPQVAMIANNLAQMKYDEGNYNDALKWLKKARGAAETFGMRNLILLVNHLNAIIELALGKSFEAKERLLKNIENCKRFGNRFVYAISLNALIESSLLNLDFNKTLSYGKESLEVLKNERNSVFYKEILIEVLKIFIYLNEKNEMEKFIKENKIIEFLKEIPENKPMDLFLNFLFDVLIGKDEKFNTDVYENIYERLKPDYLFVCLENSIRNRNYEDAKEILKTIFSREIIFNYFSNKLRIYLILTELNDKRAHIFEKEVSRRILKEPYGIYGLRILSILWLKEKSIKKKRELRKLFISRLYYLKIHSPKWVFEKILTIDEIKKAFRGH